MLELFFDAHNNDTKTNYLSSTARDVPLNQSPISLSWKLIMESVNLKNYNKDQDEQFQKSFFV